MQRRICPACNKNQVAVNYKKQGKTYYRTRCDTCIRRNKKEPSRIPAWHKAGYKKKSQCEKCGFKSKTKAQIMVWHVDGDLGNNNKSNLVSVCLNCGVEVSDMKLGWRPSAVLPDF